MCSTKSILALAALAAALILPTSSTAATSYTDTISGYEYYATSTDGKFTGTGNGALPGSWNADVQHTALCIGCSTTATITGGNFHLATTLNSLPTLITGSFSGGTVQVTNPGAGCTNQTFAVNGTLSNAGPWSTGTGSGTFTATLTHYRYSVFGYCVTYGASVTGTLTLNF
jgi:hypothetical protein